MTIRRQYQLPNCSLILDGLSIDPSPGSEDIMSLLVNAECRISGLERSLNGGYNFFAALVRAVSQYGQEVLSGFAHPQVVEGEPLLVHINPGEGPYHHLVVQPEIADLGDGGDGRAIDIKLSAVQLFDLTEAVDQFFADQQTLPELEPALSPLARRFVRNDEPLSDKAVPAVLGIGGLVAATMALGLLPVPELRDPTVETGERIESIESVAGERDTTGLSSEGPGGSEGDEDSEPEVAIVPFDEDDFDEEANEGTVSEGETSSEETSSEETSSELVSDTDTTDSEASDSEASDSEASDSESDGESDSESNDEASSELDESAVAGADDIADESSDIESSDSTDDTVAQDGDAFSTYDDFKAETDSASGSTNAASGSTAGGRTIQFEDEPPAVVSGFADVRRLNSQLKQSIIENRDQPRFGDAISYRVRVSEDGTVIGYSPVTDSAGSAIDETPLPKLVGEADDDASTVDYRVVFTERGVVEVGPWFGWSYYE